MLTPHVGELGRLLGMTAAEVMADRLSAAAALSEKTGAVVVAKGVPTYIVSPKSAVLPTAATADFPEEAAEMCSRASSQAYAP